MGMGISRRVVGVGARGGDGGFVIFDVLEEDYFRERERGRTWNGWQRLGEMVGEVVMVVVVKLGDLVVGEEIFNLARFEEGILLDLQQSFSSSPARHRPREPQIESGDKTSLHVDYPILFELHSDAATTSASHCRVLEFITGEGMIYMPYWLRDHAKELFLTTGDSVMVACNNKKYYIDIIDTKPSNEISIIETDCELDFAPLLHYKDPEKPAARLRLSKRAAQVPEAATVDERRFKPFSGAGRRLVGKPLKYQRPLLSESKDKQSDVANGAGQSSAGPSTQGAVRQSRGKLVFGSNTNCTLKESSKEVAKEAKEEAEKKEDPKFQPFTGKSTH